MAANGDLAQVIGQQVEAVILQAKKDSESRVRSEFQNVKIELRGLQTTIEELHGRVQRAVEAKSSKPAAEGGGNNYVDRQYLSQRITQLEQKLGGEVQALKQDLHRTILAHNHNSDLLRHHRDALDEARRKVDTKMRPNAQKIEESLSKVQQLVQQGQQKQRSVDSLTELLGALEQQVNAMFATSSGGALGGGLGGGYPGLDMGALGGLSLPTAEADAAADHSFNSNAPAFLPGADAATQPAAEAPATVSFGAPVDLPPGIEQPGAFSSGGLADAIAKAAGAALADAEAKQKAQAAAVPEEAPPAAPEEAAAPSANGPPPDMPVPPAPAAQEAPESEPTDEAQA